MKLTIGMAHHEDYHGAIFSIQAIRTSKFYQENKDKIEFIIVDNSTGSKHSEALKTFVENSKENINLIPFSESTGTTQTRELIFKEASGDAVICMDCHVVFQEGAIEKLFNFYKENPDTKNLYSGPLLGDNNEVQATQFNLQWRGQMWGIWGMARECLDCGHKFSFIGSNEWGNDSWGSKTTNTHLYPQKDMYLNMSSFQKQLNGKCERCGSELKKSKNNISVISENSEPFQIPANGLGVFSCMKHAWLGFNENFKEFGGEEGYIHIKYAKAGYKTICLPYLRWWHRFGRPDGVKYLRSLDSKLKNYIFGFQELGLNLESIRFHFMDQLEMIDQERWDYLVLQCEEMPEHFAMLMDAPREAYERIRTKNADGTTTETVRFKNIPKGVRTKTMKVI